MLRMNNKGLKRILLIGAGIILLCSILALILFGKTAFISAFITSILVLILFVFYTNRRYKEIDKVNDYLAGLLAGNYNLDIRSNEEGELSILKNNIYKATVLLREKNDLLEKEKQTLADMLANISHQLKTPLTSLMMMNELIMQEKSYEKRIEFLKIEEKQLNKMNWLIATLLRLSKLDAGTIRLKREEVDVSELIDESLSPFLIQMELVGISLNKTVCKGLIKTDKNWTTEAFRNIIKNCIEHMNSGGVLTIKVSENNLYHCIIISDTGSGISEEDLKHIFERFYKSKTSLKEGVGIGLSLSKSIIEKQHGFIKATSKQGIGSSFEIRFYK